MMKLSIENLRKKLTRSTWLPLSIMSAFFVISVVVVLQKQYRAQLESTKFALSDLVFSQETAFAQEVYLNLEPAISHRIQRIVKDWSKKHPDTEVCIELSLLNVAGNKTLEGCSPKIENQGIIQKKLTEEKSIRIGEKALAQLKFTLVRPMSFLDLFPPIVLASLILSLIISVVSYRMLIQRIEKVVLRPLLEKVSQDERNAAIANTTRMLAHDIRKPFSILRLSLYKLCTSTNEEVRKRGTEIERDVRVSLDAVDAMLQDILDISRNMQPSLEVVSIPEIVEQAVATVTRLYPLSQVSVTYDFKHTSRVMADKNQLLRVFSNIIENAFQAMEERGSIELLTREHSSDELEISIRNSGPLIPIQEQKRIFEAFVSGKKNGTGLGLAIAKKIVEAHHGKILCCSNGNVGTVFSLLLPSTNNQVTNPDPARVTPHSGINKANILIFDDEQYVHHAWREFAQLNPFFNYVHFVSWENFVAQDAFSLAENAIAFVDIRYKNSKYDGLEIAKYLKKFGVKRLYAITSDKTAASESGLFDRVFDKEIPEDFDRLVG